MFMPPVTTPNKPMVAAITETMLLRASCKTGAFPKPKYPNNDEPAVTRDTVPSATLSPESTAMDPLMK